MSQPEAPLGDYLAAEIRAERARHKMTIPELAKASGIGERTLARYLNGTREITTATLDAMCRALGVSISDMFSRAVAAREASVPAGTARRHRSG